ncbi:hypothetical protein, partial [Enterobacter cloacae complex sp. 4DZ1-17B1]|uniref:hypothetical protein n=1 Tax=Enterobacter cloacae complex sp. 4DZ1-17B1 TaxID=2511991 RepID=UPI001CA4B91C
ISRGARSVLALPTLPPIDDSMIEKLRKWAVRRSGVKGGYYKQFHVLLLQISKAVKVEKHR